MKSNSSKPSVLLKRSAMSGKFVNLTTPFSPGEISLSDYPRPHFMRDSFLNLNGYWDYAISKNETITQYDGKILVPFSPEASLSGVNRTLKVGEYLFYRREVILPQLFKQDRLVLHFGAVDQEVEVYINNQLIGVNKVAYIPFSFDISHLIGEDKLTFFLKVKDVTSLGHNLIGKQKEARGGIWYTPQSGITQTVWLESYPKQHIKSVDIKSNLDHEEVSFSFDKVGTGEVDVQIYYQGRLVTKTTTSDQKLKLQIDGAKGWTPEEPHLYDVYLSFGQDKIKTYFAFRKIEKRIAKDGVARLFLNNKAIFQSGVLDQGYYPDGLLTPPNDEAMIADIKLVKAMGFNMIRKHIKIEPLRFYYHCDRLGLLVWQDMPNLVPSPKFNMIALKAMLFEKHPSDQNTSQFGVNSHRQKQNYYQGLKVMIDYLKSYVSIVTWVPFNEGWGQFDAEIATKMIAEMDPTRLIDHASGWSDQGIGDYYSRHIYFTKLNLRPKKFKGRIVAISEFGGYSLALKNHVFNPGKTFGYRVYKKSEKLSKAFEKLYLKGVKPLIKKGLSAIIYTQLSDVEDEVNGLITYDRKVVKFDKEKVQSLNNELYLEFNKLKLDD